MLIDTLTAKLVADTGQFESGMARARGSVQQFDLRTTGADRGLSMLRRGFESLAVQATGVAGPLGRVAAGLLQIGGGELGLMAAVATIGAIAGAYRLASHDATELTNANKALRESYVQLAADGNKVVTIGLEIAKTQLKVAAAHAQVLSVSAKLGLAQGLMNVPVLGAVAKMFVGQEARALEQAGIQVNILSETLKLLESAQREAAAAAALQAAELANEQAGLALTVTHLKSAQESMLDFARGTEAATREIQKMNAELGLLKDPFIEARGLNAKSVVELGAAKGRPLFDKSVLEESVIDPTADLLKRGAYNAGRQFVEGLIQGTASLSDALANFMMGFIGNSILGVVGKVLGIASPSRVAMAIGRNFSMGLAMGIGAGGPGVAHAAQQSAMRMVGGATFRLSMGGMPPAMNPLAAARDQDYQRFFREGALVARADGFKFT